jgi:hypothetical protein
MTAQSFSITLVSGVGNTQPQQAVLTLWCNNGQKITQSIIASDPSVESIFIEFAKLLSTLQTANGVTPCST